MTEDKIQKVKDYVDTTLRDYVREFVTISDYDMKDISKAKPISEDKKADFYAVREVIEVLDRVWHMLH